MRSPRVNRMCVELVISPTQPLPGFIQLAHRGFTKTPPEPNPHHTYTAPIDYIGMTAPLMMDEGVIDTLTLVYQESVV